MDNFFEILIYILIFVIFISSFFKKKKIPPKTSEGSQGNVPQLNDQDKKVDSPVSAEVPAQPKSYDIVKELEDFFNLTEPTSETKQEHSDKTVYEGYRQRDDMAKVPEESFHKTTSSEHSFSDTMRKDRKDYIKVPEESFHKITSSEHSQSEMMRKDRDEYIKVPEESFHQTSLSEHTFVDPWDKKRKTVEQRKKSIGSKTKKKAEKFEENLEVRDTAATDIIRTIKSRLKDPSSLKEYIIISEIIGKPKALK